MNKKLVSSLLLGLLVVGTTGTVTSCKDYDDDINANTQAINDVKSALETCKTSCEASIAGLKTQLEAKSGEIATLTSQLATVKATADAAATKAALQEEINRALAARGCTGCQGYITGRHCERHPECA
jgi:TolA-binding protein